MDEQKTWRDFRKENLKRKDGAEGQKPTCKGQRVMNHLVKAMVFPLVMYGCESWTVKKAEHQRIDAFELWYWRRHLRVPWMPRKSNQSIVKEVNPD